MLEAMTGLAQTGGGWLDALQTAKGYFLIFAGFSVVVFFHELGHFIAAKLCDVRVDKFAIGFGRELFGFSKGETRYSFNLLPLGGYVKMLGQEDFAVDKTGEWVVKDDPRAFTHKSVGQRMIIVSAGVFMNIIFAAVAFALVFMIGMEQISSEIGQILPGSPAEKAGLQVGDRIISVNNDWIRDHSDLKMAIVLADPDEPLIISYERKDSATGLTKVETVTLMPEMNPDQNMLQIGVAPPKTNQVGLVLEDPNLPPDKQIKVRDNIVSVEGEVTSNFWRVRDVLANLRGQYGELVVERPKGPEEGAPTENVHVKWRARQFFLPTAASENASGHLLGLVPRCQVVHVAEGQRGDIAGVRVADVILRWGGQIAPTLAEINRIRRENPERDIAVTVYRPGKGEMQLTVRPKVPLLRSRSNPIDGILFGAQENDQLIVADIVTRILEDMPTPAAALKGAMPRGSLITKLNGDAIKSWDELARKCIELAGQKVTLSWSYQGQPEQSGEIEIPHTLGTTFPLQASDRILSINDITNKEIEMNGRRLPISAKDWVGAREILRDFIGKKAVVKYQGSLDPEPRTAVIEEVKPEMLDTWVQRISYDVDTIATRYQTIVVKETNPLKASVIGMRKTYYFIEQVYITMQRMIFTRSMGIDQISGPVGILKMGSQFADAGLPPLLYFLALISANLAVINFLPLPIVDGGIFVFLLIEKIKGSPISMKVQVATQLIGLALIIGIFLFVTILDVQKW